MLAETLESNISLSINIPVLILSYNFDADFKLQTRGIKKSTVDAALATLQSNINLSQENFKAAYPLAQNCVDSNAGNIRWGSLKLDISNNEVFTSVSADSIAYYAQYPIKWQRNSNSEDPLIFGWAGLINQSDSQKIQLTLSSNADGHPTDIIFDNGITKNTEGEFFLNPKKYAEEKAIAPGTPINFKLVIAQHNQAKLREAPAPQVASSAAPSSGSGSSNYLFLLTLSLLSSIQLLRKNKFK